MNLYITADKVGQPNHGGGSVTFHESSALAELEPCEVWDYSKLAKIGVMGGEPWIWDHAASRIRDFFVNPPKLAHFYAGTFSKTIDTLKRNGTKVTYTAAAHSIEESRREHELLGFGFNYPHLTDPELWKRYVEGYVRADVVVCPSKHSEDCMRSYGCKRVEIIPHGIQLPDNTQPLPQRFTVGYLGAYGADKGVIYLLQAWKKLNYKDATLILAGRDSTSLMVRHCIDVYGGGNIRLMGWVNGIADFYNSISLYVQPSVTEGFGIEVLEAMSYGRPCLCSKGAGAADIVPYDHQFNARNVEQLCERIEKFRISPVDSIFYRTEAAKYTWDIVREQYKTLWRTLMPCKT